MRKARWPRLGSHRRGSNLSGGVPRGRIEEQHEFTCSNVFCHLRSQLMRPDNPHLGIGQVMVIKQMRYMAANVVVAAERISVSDDQHFGQLITPDLIQQLTVAVAQFEM